ncbi:MULTISPECIES: cell wall metabolism sensor histidine kinase WalK [Lactobacillales]|uniref:cell wall metabolism sensor histidine kinase WalK n=1 Tax=Lactobacillales TaxID=186826 RepID=UPI00065F943F|nr:MULTISPECIES: cell wall metabolism sensor histidine kinase WalK [Lactobacillales]KAF3299179.1 cell wall metabolism sensor histidine kinase WalK [Carnobacterium sp. PL12RED10]KAF3299549.1 cell wall metabolism sensor histidine kinase WalK [Carnobacterium sp. PL17RED31]MBR2130170.1 cell wall metabolism sensor histidine kinase WalK [Aerococcus sp.]
MPKTRKKSGIPFFKSIHFKIPVIFILTLLISLQIVGAYFIRSLETEMLTSFDDQVTSQTTFIIDNIQSVMEDEDLNEDEKETQVNSILRRFNNDSVLEIQLFDSNGFLLATSNPTSQAYIGQRTVDEDIEETLYTGIRSETSGYDSNQEIRIKKFVTPIFSTASSGAMIGILNVTANLETIYSQIQNIMSLFLIASGISLVFTTVLAMLISSQIINPLQKMRDQTKQIAEGNYSTTLDINSEDEIGQLAESINYLSVRVGDAQDLTEAERQRLDSVLRHMTDGVIATDRRGKITIINDRSLSILNKTQEEVIGESIIEALDLSDRFSFRELFDQHESILLNYANDEGETIIRAEYSVIQRESGFISGLVWVLTDITEHEKIEHDRKQFVSNISHELRTPLTSVRSYSEALVDGAIKDEKVAVEFLNVIQTETDRMIRMISDLLHLSRMDAKQQVINRELIIFKDLVNHILDRFDMMLQSEDYEGKNYIIKRELMEEEVWVEIDQDKLIQVIDNIMNNAIKYSPDGGTIYVRLMSTHNQLVLSIQDQGLGIPQESIPHLFDRFYRVDKARSRAQGGSGLGLSIAKEEIELHNGTIWVNSIENKGTTFFISLPFEEFDSDDWAGEDEWADEE